MIELNSIHNLDAITLLEQIYEDYGDESINMFLIDFPYTFKGKQRIQLRARNICLIVNLSAYE